MAAIYVWWNKEHEEGDEIDAVLLEEGEPVGEEENKGVMGVIDLSSMDFLAGACSSVSVDVFVTRIIASLDERDKGRCASYGFKDCLERIAIAAFKAGIQYREKNPATS